MSDAVERAVAHLAAMVAMPTPTGRSCQPVVDYISTGLEAAGARVRLLREGDQANLVASWGPEADGGIMLAGHADTVPAEEATWTGDPFTLREAGGRLYGRGTCDMKGFLACCVAVGSAFRQASRPVQVAVTYDEEVGCFGARALASRVLREGPRPGIVVVGEPTGLGIVEGHKGCCEYTTRFHGLEGHGSQPARGVSAVENAARFVTFLTSLREGLEARTPKDSPFDPPWTTVSVGRMQGGSARNAIAGHAEVEWEFRPVREADRVWLLDRVREFCEGTLLPGMREIHPEARIETETVGEVAGLEPRTRNAARDLVAAALEAPVVGVVPFGTEAGIYQEMGADVVVCGPGDIAQAHRADEYVARDQIAACVGLLEGIARRCR